LDQYNVLHEEVRLTVKRRADFWDWIQEADAGQIWQGNEQKAEGGSIDRSGSSAWAWQAVTVMRMMAVEDNEQEPPVQLVTWVTRIEHVKKQSMWLYWIIVEIVN
jgi:hypothetical protein